MNKRPRDNPGAEAGHAKKGRSSQPYEQHASDKPGTTSAPGLPSSGIAQTDWLELLDLRIGPEKTASYMLLPKDLSWLIADGEYERSNDFVTYATPRYEPVQPPLLQEWLHFKQLLFEALVNVKALVQKTMVEFLSPTLQPRRALELGLELDDQLLLFDINYINAVPMGRLLREYCKKVTRIDASPFLCYFIAPVIADLIWGRASSMFNWDYVATMAPELVDSIEWTSRTLKPYEIIHSAHEMPELELASAIRNLLCASPVRAGGGPSSRRLHASAIVLAQADENPVPGLSRAVAYFDTDALVTYENGTLICSGVQGEPERNHRQLVEAARNTGKVTIDGLVEGPGTSVKLTEMALPQPKWVKPADLEIKEGGFCNIHQVEFGHEANAELVLQEMTLVAFNLYRLRLMIKNVQTRTPVFA